MRTALLLLAATAGSSIGLAQSRAEAERPPRLVRLNVAVTDAAGEPVTDLKAAEVFLREDGRHRHIDFFRFAGSKRPVAAPAPGEFTNRPAAPPTVILLDRWNERVMTTAFAGAEIIHAIQNLETTDGVYLYILTLHGDLYPVRPIPGTEGDARAEVQSSPLQLASRLNDALKKLSGLRDLNKDDPAIRYNLTSEAFTTLGQQMAAMAGRKNLIWVTHGVPLLVPLLSGDLGDFTSSVMQLGMAAAQAGIVVYPVDQSGSGAGAVPDESSAALRLIADATGGRWYPSDDIDRAAAEAGADARSNYLLAYHTPILEKDRKYHKIRLSSTRKGIHFQTRDGYPGDTPEPYPEALEEAILGAARRGPFDADEIGIRVAVTADPKTKSTHMVIRVDPADILLLPRNGRYQGHLALALAEYIQGFLNGAASGVGINIDVSAQELQTITKDGLLIPQNLVIPEKVQKVRVIVYDRALHSVGSVTIPVISP